MTICVIDEVMNQKDSRWTRPFLTKVVVIVVILLISLQYFVNVAVVRRNDSVIFLKLLDSSIQKILNQSGLVVQGSMREMVTKMEKPKELCPVIPPKLKGHVNVNMQVAAWAYIEQENTMLAPGGRYKPITCQARHRVAVIIPYRDREIHLKIFLRNIHPFLQRQQLDYGIFVVELTADVKFNRALLMNVGFVEALKQHDYQCFVFHDVDLLPEDDRNLYTCPQVPRHMSVAIDRLQYKLPYTQIFGGVCAITTEHFKIINGFSNIFFGWGGEDDDMYRRILYSNLTVIRYSPEVARYKMLVHAKDPSNNDRHMLLKTVKARRLTDGLSSLIYKVEKLETRPLYTWILVSVNETEIMENEPVHKIAFKNLKLKVPVQKKAAVKNDKPKVNGKSNNSPQAAKVQKVAESKLNTNLKSPEAKEKKSDKNLPQAPKVAENKSFQSPIQTSKVAENKSVKNPLQAPKIAEDKSVKNPLQAQNVVENKLDKNKLQSPNVVENESDKIQPQAPNVGKQAGQSQKANIEINANQNSQSQKIDPVKGVVKKQVVKEKTANIPKKPEKIMKESPLIRSKNPKQVSWIPTEFKGIIPTNLTKFKPLPIIVPEHMQKKKPVKVVKSVKRVVQIKNVVRRDQIKKDGMNPVSEKSNNNIQPGNVQSVNNNRKMVEAKLGQQVLSKRQKR